MGREYGLNFDTLLLSANEKFVLKLVVALWKLSCVVDTLVLSANEVLMVGLDLGKYRCGYL